MSLVRVYVALLTPFLPVGALSLGLSLSCTSVCMCVCKLTVLVTIGFSHVCMSAVGGRVWRFALCYIARVGHVYACMTNMVVCVCVCVRVCVCSL